MRVYDLRYTTPHYDVLRLSVLQQQVREKMENAFSFFLSEAAESPAYSDEREGK